MERKITNEALIWAASLGIQLTPDSPRNIQQLYDAVQRGEMYILKDDEGKPFRSSRASMVDVFYNSADGRRYHLGEERYKLNEGRTLEEFLAGDLTAVTPSRFRRNIQSIAETLYFAHNGTPTPEDPREGAIRALWEELFRMHYPPDCQDEIDPTLRSIIEERLHSLQMQESDRDPEDPNNSFQGLRSVSEYYLHEITFDPEMGLPITEMDGVPLTLYEFEAEKGYINLYPWIELPEEQPVS